MQRIWRKSKARRLVRTNSRLITFLQPSTRFSSAANMHGRYWSKSFLSRAKSAHAKCAAPAVRKLLTTQRKSGYCRRFRSRKRVLSSVSPTKPASKPCPSLRSPQDFTNFPQTFVTTGAPIVLPKFSQEVDADACLAIVIGKAGKRVHPEQAWDYVAGVTLLIDITARDINRREGLTTNNLLGKNFPSSTAIGPAVLLKPTRKELESVVVKLSLDGSVKQEFSLRDCVFNIEQIIARWSILGIKPGDFIAIGASMALQGDRLQNPAPLKIGSSVRCFSPAIGELSHQVVSSKGVRR